MLRLSTTRLRSVLLCSTVALLANLFWLPSLLAQERKGVLTGTVTDITLGVLPGARVEVQPKGTSAVTNTQGEYTITDLAPGHYTVTISYVGYQPYSTDVTVNGGQLV